jgi:hypothetical protein
MNSRDDDSETPIDGDATESLERPDPEVPEADALDQAREVVPGERRGPVSRAIDVPEADAIEQAIEEPLDVDNDAPSNPSGDDNPT